MSARNEILAKLGRTSEPRPATFPGRPLVDDLWDYFALKLEPLGGRLVNGEDIAEYLQRSVWLEPALEDRLGHRCPNRAPSTWDAEVGITIADYAIAETASIVAAAGPQRLRMASLTPPTHIAIVEDDAIVARVEDGFARLGERTTVITNGSSRTADIEGVLVRGVHGPGTLLVVRASQLDQ